MRTEIPLYITICLACALVWFVLFRIVDSSAHVVCERIASAATCQETLK